jgi:ABC-type Co2+ transport system permease subunit
MHIEPGIVQGAKIILSYGTATASFGYTARLAAGTIKEDGVSSLVARSLCATAMVFVYFEVFPHYPVGISEVHLIMGSTLFLLFGPAPAAIGLAAGLFMQGVLFAPSDLPQYTINITTLLVPLFAMGMLANRAISPGTAYKDLEYSQVLMLSAVYQGGIISWVAFWAFYGQGFGADNISQVLAFGAAYATVIVIETLLDLSVLAGAGLLYRIKDSDLIIKRFYQGT